MRTRRLLILAVVSAAWVVAVASTRAQSLSPIEELGKNLFFDSELSTPGGQSCAACHAADTGFTGPSEAINAGEAVYPGAVHSRRGNRKPPTAAYGGDSPVVHFDSADGV